jgi:prophage DNA circulation protein
MSYQDRQRAKGSYKGTEFWCVSHDQSGGRRVTKHQFPKRDKPFPEDLGREGEDISIKIICSGDDYDLERDELIKLFSAEGPGELITPWFGSVFVQHGKYSVTHSRRDGGMCEVSVSFTEMNDPSFPTSDKSIENEINETSVALSDESKTYLVDGYEIDSITDQVVDAFTDLISGIESAFALTESVATSIFEASVLINTIKSDIKNFLIKPFLLADHLSSSISSLKDALAVDDGEFSATRILNRSAKTPFEQIHDQIFESKSRKKSRVKFTTQSSLRASITEDKLDNFLSVQAISQEASFLVENPSYNFEPILERIEEQIALADNDVIYTNLNKLKVQLIDLRDQQGKSEAPLILNHSENALNLLYERGYKLEDIDNFLLTNSISNPNLVGPQEVV